MKSLIAATVVASGLVLSGSAFAQQAGLVNVNLGDVRPEIAKNLNVDVSQIPVTVQVPVGVAATVCGVAANVLGQQGGQGGSTCTAKNTSTALNQAVQNQQKGQSAGSPGGTSGSAPAGGGAGNTGNTGGTGTGNTAAPRR